MRAFKAATKCPLALGFVAIGVFHFVRPDLFVRTMPPYLPWHYELVLVSGAFEVLGGIGLLVPRFTVPAAWGLIALLIAVFPANVHMALNPELFPEFAPPVLYGRLPIQGALIAWAYWFTRVSSK
jgi:uncharacterized membrane protein